jgi:hypothetical protein
MNWELLIMQAPLFGGDKLYNALLALMVFIAGVALLLKVGSKWGLLLIAAAAFWAFLTFKDLLYM